MKSQSPSTVAAPFVVLGMHRSGTSCLAGTLQVAGVELGSVFTRNPHNRKGNREHPEVMVLHEAVLAANDCAWDQPPAAYPLIWPKAMQRRRDAFVRRFQSQPYWGFKDPRTLLVLEGWQQCLPRLQPVGTFRHPWPVCKSLMTRAPGRIIQQQGLALWDHYNRRLLQEWRRRPFPLLEFSQPPQQLLNALECICRALQLPYPARHAGFFDQTLRQQVPTDKSLPPETAKLYQDLQAAASCWKARCLGANSS